MVLVRISRDWEQPENFFRQIPGNQQIWGSVSFTENPVEECDYLVCLQRPKEDIIVKCPEGNTWIIMQEPPVKWFEFYKRSYKYFGKVYTYFPYSATNNCGTLPPLLPWHVNKSYDQLNKIVRKDLEQKQNDVAWITSGKKNFPGQHIRMNFKDFLLQSTLPFKLNLYGRDFAPIDDKYDGLFPSRYCISVENFTTTNYWTEKVTDALLSWCLPFYWGAPNLEEYLPKDSFIRIDPSNPQKALMTIQTAIQNNEWEKRLDAIETARDLILNKYQFFPFISKMVEDDVKSRKGNTKSHFIPANPFPKKHMLKSQVTYFRKRIWNFMLGRTK